ncbi:DUF5689 domain-containing protein [Antarcticibacterium sp. 1MA-6-2]|uniref:DUF5689 domain-containing protein n=1 Tax=Antarcticibacterium sp. 1MA-6-2 TaxID=2908210 RepID=UPI001F294C79|nr:DUF5689 domain-containing protein [Antarcticibacterium sp. 1MA-6-2]UJH91352.1 DUF5689 domain-containing protein [Antarcticibacterium sp. 1MA-6-2]
MKLGGIAIFGDLVTEASLYQIGDSIRVTGTRAVYNELIQISEVEIVEYLGVAKEPIEPKAISLSEIEKYRGQLVKITDVSFPNPGQLFFGNANYTVTDAAGGTGELRIDSDVSTLVGKLQPEVCAEVVGVVGRYNQINQLLPRNLEDLPCATEFNPTYPGMDISRELTFDAVTWNIEWFGDAENAPSARNENSDEIQKEAVKAVLLKLDADVIAVNEISDEVLFGQMVSEMEGYDYILSDATSYPDSPGGQKVGFIYNSETVSVTSTRAMFTSVHPFYDGDGSLLQDYPESPDRFYASGRLPFLMEAEVTIGGVTQEMKFIALHARANGSNGAQGRYDMRKYDVEVLKDSLDTYYPHDKVMILGDYNDDVDFTVANVTTTVSTYASFVQDAEDYFIPTATLNEQGFRSYVVGDYNDMIDHIMLTNELENNYITGSARVHYELYNGDYTFTTSDHLPVSVRLTIQALKDSSVKSTFLCNETDTATATVNAEGGIAPYTYLWSNGQTTQTATSLGAGNYSVEVTDALGTTVSSEVTVENANPILVEMIEDQVVYLGFGSDCTTLSATSISGGSGSYSYEWSTGETSESISVCPTESSAYTLTVTDANGCSTSSEVKVEVQNISCGNGNKTDKVQVCFQGKTHCVAQQAVPALLKNGAQLGSCGTSSALDIEEITASPNPTSGYSVVRFKSTT